MPEDAAVVAEASGGPTGESLSCVTCRSRKLRVAKEASLQTEKPQVEGLLRQTGESGLTAAGVGAAVNAEGAAVGAIEAPIIEDAVFQGIDYGDTPDISLDDSIFVFNHEDPAAFTGRTSTQPLGDFNSNTFSGELIDLGGVFEALPPFEVMEDLNRLYFERQSNFTPIIHRGRYLQSYYSAPHMKPPMCLQYAIWALASNGDSKYHAYHDVFYRRARQYADIDEMKGYGEHFITVAYAQTWCVLATDEAKSMMFTRAAMSCARAVRLSGMMGLHHLDSPPDESSPTILPPRDWAELEERRRAFWGIFCIDSHCSISTGWPHLIDMAQVTTHLPSTEAAFCNGEPMETCSIHDVFKGDHSYSSFAANVVVCHLFNLILKHAHRPAENDNPENYEYGEYWKRHRDIDNILSSAFMFLPEPFRLPENYPLERIETYNLPEFAKRISQDRLGAAAQEIVNIMKLTSHLNSGSRTPLGALSLFCATSVFIYFCKETYTPTNVDSLDFILSAMEAIGRTHSLTRSFLRQALLDIEQNGVQNIIQLPRVARLSRHLDNSTSHHVPLLARTRMSRHSEAQPPLPGLPIGKSMSRNAPLPSASWARLAHNSGSSPAGPEGHAHKRQRTETPSSNGSSLPFSHLSIRSESSVTSNQRNTEAPTPSVVENTEPSTSNQNTINNNQSRIGVTIAPSILGHHGPKPFRTAGRETPYTRVSKGGIGSWELGGLCVSAMAENDSSDIPSQILNPGAMGLNWDILDTDLGLDTSTAVRIPSGINENVDSGGGAPDAG
ncbi:hypothetical protein E0Z10_g405 [Xylaria hypoxylon]|uniref:Xylanolytic transcriptional activator regulatory domain-containing protein n=1 Tax=Xylaria hypoxylon TaxID=37992 RepID=A0A4Z0YWK0_9PEZI|nr:hypothetical protein E0Z10_g405 [Xylaria hypoxylon]